MKRKIRLQGKLLIALAVVLCIAGTTVGTLALTSVSNNGVTVANFVGKDKKTVETWAKKNDVSDKQISYAYAYDDEKDKDIVLKQSIKAGNTLQSDETLKVTVSRGADPQKEFELPDFTGKEEKEVRKWFQDNKFTNVTYQYEDSSEVESGKFISLDHETGTKVKRSDAITVLICTPLEGNEVEIPDFTGYTKADLDNWAAENSINISYIERASDTTEAGTVLSISVNKGDRLNAGDTITVEISTGPVDEEESRTTAAPKPADNGNVQEPSNVSGGDQTPTEDPGNNIQPEQPAEAPTLDVSQIPYILYNDSYGSKDELVSAVQRYVNNYISGQVSISTSVGTRDEIIGISTTTGSNTVTDGSQIIVSLSVIK